MLIKLTQIKKNYKIYFFTKLIKHNILNVRCLEWISGLVIKKIMQLLQFIRHCYYHRIFKN